MVITVDRAAAVRFKQPQGLRGVDKLGRRVGADDIRRPVVQLVAKPHSDWHGISQLRPRDRLLVQQVGKRVAQYEFCGVMRYLVAVAQFARGLEDLFVQIRNARLQRMRHAQSVALYQDIRGQPGVQVAVLHFHQRAVAAGARIDVRRAVGERHRFVIAGHDAALCFLRKDKGVADEAFFHRSAAAQYEVLALEGGRKRAGKRGQRLFDKLRQPVYARAGERRRGGS